MGGVGVDECDLEAEEPAPGPVVDQLGAIGRKLVERGADIVDLERDVVHPGPMAGEELADRRFLAERGEQLDAVSADPEGRRLDALIGNGLSMLEPGAEEPFVGGQRLVEIVDGDPEMMNPARLHAADATEAPLAVPLSGRAGFARASV